MKKLVITAEKGGVGKTALNCQLALYLALKLKKRVLFMDFDLQNNASNTLKAQGGAVVAGFSVYDVLTKGDGALPSSPFVLIEEGVRNTLELIDQAALPSGLNDGTQKRDLYLQNLVHFLDRVDPLFDVCIMDTPPTPVITHNLPLVVADYLLAPLTLSQESIDGIEAILFSKPWGYKNIKANFNKQLEFLGILPVMVQAGRPDQTEVLNLLETEETTRQILFTLADDSPASVPNLAPIRVAQGQGYFVGDLKTSSGREAWKRLKPVFDAIVLRLELES